MIVQTFVWRAGIGVGQRLGQRGGRRAWRERCDWYAALYVANHHHREAAHGLVAAQGWSGEG